MRKYVLVMAVALVAIASAGVAPSASSQPAGSLVGTWARTTTCAELASAFRSAGIAKLVNEMVLGNGFIPGVQNPINFVTRHGHVSGQSPASIRTSS